MLGLWMVAAMVEAHAGSGFFGLELRPLSRQDLVWVAENRTSGTAVGEFDGTLRPVLTAFGGGWFSRYVGLSAGLTYAHLDRGSRSDEIRRMTRTAVLRPSLDLRIGWMEPRLRVPIPWVVVGLHGDIPIASDASNGFSPEEQDAANAVARDTRYRLGGFGGRAGVGVDYRLMPGFMLGGQATLGLHRAGYTGGDTRFATLWMSTEASLLLTFEWPPPDRAGRRGSRPAETEEISENLDDPGDEGGASPGVAEGA